MSLVNLNALKLKIVNEETFKTVLEKLKKDIYSSKTPLPNENMEYRSLFKDIFTDYINDLVEELELQNFLIYLIHIVITPILDTYNKINKVEVRFMLRGGNILKMYKDKFEDRLSEKTQDLLKTSFSKYFEFSDIDFMIYINNEDSFDSVKRRKCRDDIQVLLHYTLSITRNLLKYFVKLDQKIDEHIDVQLVEDSNIKKQEKEIPVTFTDVLFKESDIVDFNSKITNNEFYVKLITQDNLVGYPDYISLNNQMRGKMIVIPTDQYDIFQNEHLNQIIAETQDAGSQYFYITDNDKVKNIINNTYFRLTRLLADFALVYVDTEGLQGILHTFGELYDFSIINKGDIMYNIYNDKSTMFSDLKFKYLDQKQSFPIRVPKLKTSINDLLRILFLNRFPWSDPKYQKRIYRLYLLLYIYSLKREDKKQIHKFLETANKFSENDYQKLKLLDIKSIRRNYNYIKSFELSKTNHDKFLEFEQTINDIEKILIEL